MRAVALIAATLTACATFHLATTGTAPPGATTQLDILVCKDQARAATDTPARQAVSFLAGATLIGAPLDYVARKQIYRKAFADCLTARGWTGITLATD